MFRKLVVCVVASALVTGCAGSNYRPMVDTRGVDLNRYESDLRDCQSYASQTAGAGTGGAVGAVAGAVLGAALAAAGGSRYDRHATARIGAVAGAVGGGAEAEQGQQDVVRRCMSGRGYSVLR